MTFLLLPYHLESTFPGFGFVLFHTLYICRTGAVIYNHELFPVMELRRLSQMPLRPSHPLHVTQH